MSLIPWWLKLILAIALMSALYGAWHHFVKVPYENIGRAEVRKELQPKIDKLTKENGILTDSLKIQNEAVSALGEKTKLAEKNGAIAAERAKALVTALENKKTRLSAIVLHPEALDCKTQLDDISSVLKGAR